MEEREKGRERDSHMATQRWGLYRDITSTSNRHLHMWRERDLEVVCGVSYPLGGLTSDEK